MLVVCISTLFVFILAHIIVDKEFNATMRVGAFIVIGIISFLYLLFGILI